MRATIALLLALALVAGAEARMPGPPGLPGLPGARGEQGPPGGRGERGPAGQDGAAGPRGPAGELGAKGEVGSPGAQGPAGPIGATGPKGDAGVAGSKGDAGAQGPTGPKAAQFVCNATVSEAATLIAISSGVRTVNGVTCPGALITDLLIAVPTAAAASLSGYAVHHAFPTAANTLRVVVQAPVLAIGSSYTIPITVYSLTR